MKPTNSDLFSLEGRVAIVTGAGDGIGRGIAIEMAKAGADVIVADLNPNKAEETVQRIEAIGVKTLNVIGDVTKPENVDALLKKAVEEFGTVDILVNNVGGILGVRGGVGFLDITEEFWTNIINLNLKSTFFCTQAFTKLMIDQKKGGNVINLSSLTDRAPWMPVIIYGSAKAGISNFTATVAVELGKHDIRVNAICPGSIETPLVAELFREMPEMKAVRTKAVPLNRLGRPADIGRVAVFLASDAASYITGATIVVSGGLTSFL